MPIPTYNEKSGVEFTATFMDVAYAPAQPASVTCLLICEHCDKVLWEDSVTASVQADGSVKALILVPGPSVTLCNPNSPREIKRLHVIANEGADRAYSADIQEGRFYVVKAGR